MAAKKKSSARAAKAKAGAKKMVSKARAKVKKVARKKVQPIPTGFHVLTPSLVVSDTKAAIEFYTKAFGAKTRGGVATGPGGKVMHAEIKIGDSILMLSDEAPEWGSKSPKTLGGSPSSLMIYTKDADAAFARATAAGATVAMPLDDQFWGDRYGRVIDPFGHSWEIATHKEDVSAKEMARRMAAMGPPPA